MQSGFFDHEDRLAKLEKLGDPLPRLDGIVDWAAFRPLLKVIHQKQRKQRRTKAARRHADVQNAGSAGAIQPLRRSDRVPGP